MGIKSIKTKLGLAVGACTFIIIGVLVVYNTISAKKQAINFATKQALAVADEHAGNIKAEIEVALNSARTLAQAFSAVKNPDSPLDIGRDPANVILQTVLTSNKSFLATYTLWEPEAFDQMDTAYTEAKGHDKTGRFIPYWTKGVDGGTVLEPLVGYETEGVGNYYLIPKKTMKEAVIDPYLYPVQGKDVFIISLVVPILYGDKFYGIAGVDMSLEQLQQVVDEDNIYGGKAQIRIISNNGTIAASSGQKSLVGGDMRKFDENFDEELPNIKMGKELIKHDDNNLEVYTPLIIGQTDTPWSVSIIIPMELITAEATSKMWEQISIGFKFAMLSILFIVFFVRRFTQPLSEIAEVSKNVAVGKLEYKEIKTADDEIGKVNSSLKDMVSSLKKITLVCKSISIGDFSKSVKVQSEHDILGKSVNKMAENLRAVVRQAGIIAKGDYSVEMQPQSENDELGNALSEMTRSLRGMKEENERQNSLKTGQMELNERMRGEQDIAALAQKIITYLCNYLNAEIGGFYLIDDNELLSLTASYAYQKRKNLSNKFSFGEGLIGQAALEREPILITQVPEDYIRIQSGLGEASPASIIVIPLLFEDTVKGVVELGAFHEFSDHDLTFLNQAAESVSIAINSAQSRLQTSTLLHETQELAEQLQVQQEELRTSNEELEEQSKALKASEASLQLQQEELQQTNEELEEQTKLLEEQKEEVQQKNLELENARKLIEEKAGELEISSKYKSEFLANMSHELRTPLNSILLLSKLLSDNKDGNLSEKQVEFSHTIYSSGSELLNLINEVLDLTKVEAGRMDLHIEDMDLQSFATAIKRSFQPIAQEKGLNFSIDLADNLPEHIRSDRSRIDQIVKNFLSNAFKFSSQGEVALSICRANHNVDLSKSGLNSQKTISISVSDTGVGIPKDKQKLIFEAFQQADGTTSRKYGGTGLGLSISREMAKLIGGEIQLQSEENKGSTFSLFIPETLEDYKSGTQTSFEKPHETHTAGLAEGLTGQQELQSTGNPTKRLTDLEAIRDDRRELSSDDKSILIIEDDPGFAKILRNLSREKGFKVLVAGEGETGLHFADYYKPDAIILDIGLPGIDGWTVMSRLKDNPATRHIPVHFISAFDDPFDAIKMGGIGYITKPASMENLHEAFEKIENMVSKPIKNLLVVEDDENQRKAIVELIGNGDVQVTAAATGHEAYKHLSSGNFDCMVLDLGLPDMSGVELLNKVRSNENLIHLPVVVYTGKNLTKEEQITIDKYAEKIIIKGAKSPERLLDETALFLHRIETNMPEEKQKMIRLIHDKESILNGKKIMLVDDDMRNVYALKNILEEKSINVLVGKNGKEGLECLSDNPDIDLILMDIMMPEMDGYEAMGEIRKREEFKNLPIVALTAKAMKGDRAKCIEAGANDYLSKPVDADKLLSMLRVWLY